MLSAKPKTKVNYSDILPVSRSKKEARESYDRISRFYDYTEGIFEKNSINKALKHLNIKQGEIVLEIGFGTGNALIKIAECIGKSGFAHGVDISPKMLERTNRKINKLGLSDRIKLISQDAIKLPYPDKKFNAVFLSFTLELFDTPEIPEILKEIKRVLKPGGIFAVSEFFVDPDYPLRSTTIKQGEQGGFKFDGVFGNFWNYTVRFILQ